MCSVRVAEVNARIFISYRREDAPGHVLALSQLLSERFGADRIFKDTDSIAPGDDFLEAIQRELKSCSVLLAVIGREWLSAADSHLGTARIHTPNDLVRMEIATALTAQHVLVIPVLVERTAMPTADDLPPDLKPLARRNAIELSDARWQADVERLGQVIEHARGNQSAAGDGARVRRFSHTTRLLALTIPVIGLALGVWRSGGLVSPVKPEPIPSPPSEGPAGIGTSGYIEQATRLYQLSDRGAALDTAVQGLAISPDDSTLQDLLATMQRDAGEETSRAKQAAIDVGAATTAAAAFRAARNKEQDAAKVRQTDRETSIRLLWAATADFVKAKDAAMAAKRNTPKDIKLPASTDNRAANEAADRKEITDVLDRFRVAFSRKRVDDILQIYPRMPRETVQGKFKNCKQVDLTFSPLNIVLSSADTALVQMKST